MGEVGHLQRKQVGEKCPGLPPQVLLGLFQQCIKVKRIKFALHRGRIKVFPIGVKVRVAPLAELPAAPKAKVKGLFICLPQLVATLDSCKGLFSITVSDETIVVALNTKMNGALLNLSKNREPLLQL